MKTFHSFVSIACLLAMFGVGYVSAQADRRLAANSDKYVISATAGGVNFVSGAVTVSRNGASTSLAKGDSVSSGERVKTNQDGRAEILLNPGSYVRLAGGSELEFVTTSLEDLRVRLLNGSSVFEVIVDNDFRVAVVLPKSEIALTRSGVYRFDVLADGTTAMSVWKGRVELARNIEVKGGREAVINGAQPVINKFDRDEKDALDLWSRDRAKELAGNNSRLQKTSLRDSLIYSFNRGRWDAYNSFGVWVFDRRFGQWSFLPFGYGWSSPYGFGYGFDMWDCRLPRYVYYPPIRQTQGPTTTAGVPTNGQVPTARTRSRSGLPPFMKHERRVIRDDDTPMGFPGVIRKAPTNQGAGSQTGPAPSTRPAQRGVRKQQP